MSTDADVLKASDAGDAGTVIKLFPSYLQEYRAAVVPEADLKSVKSGRFDKWLRMLGRPDGDNWHKYLAAAVVDLRDSDPEVCVQGGLVNSLLFRVLAEALPPPVIVQHLRVVQMQAASFFPKGSPTTVKEHSDALDDMSESVKEAAVAQDALMRAWFNGLFTGGRGVYDDFLQHTLRATNAPHERALASLPESAEEERQHLHAMMRHATTMMFPGSDPQMRPPLPELPLLGIDCDFETFADAVGKGHFYPFLTLNQHSSELAQQLLVLQAVDKGEMDSSVLPTPAEPGSTPGRLARQVALALGMQIVVPAIHGLWTHASLLPDSGGMERLGELASRWHLHGKREVLLTGQVPPGMGDLASERSASHHAMPLHRVTPEVPTETEPLSKMQRNPFGLGVVAVGSPVDQVLPFEDRWDIVDNLEDSMSMVTSRMAAHSFMTNAPRFSDMVSGFLSTATPQHLAEFATKGEPEPLPQDGFAENPGFCKARPVKELLAPSTSQQKWAVLGATVAPGCLAAMHHYNQRN